MRFAAVLLAVAVPLLSQTVESPLVFSDLSALRTWSDTTHLGPASVDIVSYQGHELALIRRSFGSGLPACALSVFRKSANGWQECLRLPLSRGHWFDLVQDGDTLRVQADTSEVLRLSISSLVNLYP